MGGTPEPGSTGIAFLMGDIHADYTGLQERGPVPLAAGEDGLGEWLCAFPNPDGNGLDLRQRIDPGSWER